MKTTTRRALAVSAGIALTLVVVLSCTWPVWVDAWHGLGYSSTLRNALTGNVKYVEVQPIAGEASYRLTDPKRIEKLVTWLSETQQDSIIRSAPPLPSLKMRFVFNDGREEILRHSSFVEGKGDCRSDVCVSFRGYVRSGPTEALAEILSPDFMTKGPFPRAEK